MCLCVTACDCFCVFVYDCVFVCSFTCDCVRACICVCETVCVSRMCAMNINIVVGAVEGVDVMVALFSHI